MRLNMNSKLKKKKRSLNKSRILFMISAAIGIALTYVLAIFALWFLIPDFDYVQPLMVLPIIIAFKLIVYYLFKLYHLVMVNVGLDEALKIALVVALTNIVIIILTLAIPDFEFIIEYFFLFTTLLELMFMIAPRILKRLMNIFLF